MGLDPSPPPLLAEKESETATERQRDGETLRATEEAGKNGGREEVREEGGRQRGG